MIRERVRWFSGFRSRVLVATVLSSAIIVPLGSIIAITLASRHLIQQQIEAGGWLRDSDVEACRRQPDSWVKDDNDAGIVWAGDASGSLHSARAPDGGERYVPAVLRERLRAGDSVAIAHDWWQGGGIAFRRVAEAGPCSVFFVRWKPQRPLRRGLLLSILAVAALTVGGAVGLAGIVAIRPLVRRLRIVRQAADHVGNASAYQPLDTHHTDDIGAIAHALERAHTRIVDDAARLDARSRALEQHLANVAHDLRTPIASLQMELDRLMAMCGGPVARPLLTTALQDAMYIGAMVSNLRMASQFEHGRARDRDPVSFDLGAIVDRVSLRFAILGQHRRVEVVSGRPDEPVAVLGNPVMTEQVIANLVQNAVTYCDEGGHVALVLDVRDGDFTLTVVDDGPGVPPDELPRLAERAFRSDRARTRAPNGDGLGLATAREVCALAGWGFDIALEQPRGLRITVSGTCDGDASQ